MPENLSKENTSNKEAWFRVFSSQIDSQVPYFYIHNIKQTIYKICNGKHPSSKLYPVLLSRQKVSSSCPVLKSFSNGICDTKNETYKWIYANCAWFDKKDEIDSQAAFGYDKKYFGHSKSLLLFYVTFYCCFLLQKNFFWYYWEFLLPFDIAMTFFFIRRFSVECCIHNLKTTKNVLFCTLLILIYWNCTQRTIKLETGMENLFQKRISLC